MVLAIGSFLASRQHFYSAYSLFAAAIGMAILAVWVTYRTEHRLKRGKAELGRILVELSACERAAYSGNNAHDYDKLLKQIEQVKQKVSATATRYFDSSIGPVQGHSGGADSVPPAPNSPPWRSKASSPIAGRPA